MVATILGTGTDSWVLGLCVLDGHSELISQSIDKHCEVCQILGDPELLDDLVRRLKKWTTVGATPAFLRAIGRLQCMTRQPSLGELIPHAEPWACCAWDCA